MQIEELPYYQKHEDAYLRFPGDDDNLENTFVTQKQKKKKTKKYKKSKSRSKTHVKSRSKTRAKSRIKSF
jgi:arginine utilization protein RocB